MLKQIVVRVWFTRKMLGLALLALGLSLMGWQGLRAVDAAHRGGPRLVAGIAQALRVFNAAAPLATCTVPTTISGVLGSNSSQYPGTSGQQTGRLFRDGIPDSCGGPTDAPVVQVSTGARTYDAYTFVNRTNATSCVTVSVNAMTCTGTRFLYAVAYLGSFNPAAIAQNHLASSGDSPNPTINFSFNVLAGATFVLVIHEINPNAGCPGYSFGISSTGLLGCPGASVCPTITVTNPATTTFAVNTAITPQSFTQTGGSDTASFSLASGMLPNGLNLASDGTLSGTPTQTGNFPITVKATDSTGCPGTGATYNLNITCATTPVVTHGNDSGAGSLRQAIIDACAGSTITFANGVNLITLTTGELLLNKNLTIDGGSGVTVARQQGSPAFRIFNIPSGATVALNRLTITNGQLNYGDTNRGSGVYNSGTLTVTNNTISGNNAGGGGVIGAGIFSNGTLTILNSTISGNSANSPGQNYGGGLANDQGGTLQLINSTISGNSASGTNAQVGGLYNGSGSTTTITNSIITANSASGGVNRGGIFNLPL